jgi:hypothetical protein
VTGNQQNVELKGELILNCDLCNLEMFLRSVYLGRKCENLGGSGREPHIQKDKEEPCNFIRSHQSDKESTGCAFAERYGV